MKKNVTFAQPDIYLPPQQNTLAKELNKRKMFWFLVMLQLIMVVTLYNQRLAAAGSLAFTIRKQREKNVMLNVFFTCSVWPQPLKWC